MIVLRAVSVNEPRSNVPKGRRAPGLPSSFPPLCLPKPDATLDLAGAWTPSPDGLKWEREVTLPGPCGRWAMARRRVRIDRPVWEAVMVWLETDKRCGIYGAMVNGRWVMRLHHEVGTRTYLNVTPWVKFGEENEFHIICRGGGKGEVAVWLEGGVVHEFARPAGATGPVAAISPLASLGDWSVENRRSPELEYYDFMTPRRKGNFAFEAVAGFEGRAGVLRVTPKPIAGGKDTMSMYAVLAHRSGIPLPGTPSEVGLWVNGNSGWGRVIFELVDASGQRWISIGAQAKEDPAAILPKWILDQFPSPGVSDWNTDDPWGVSRINLDGWRYVAFPLPGNYPGEGYAWPGKSNWRWNKDGKVHYPLTLKKLVVELNEKVLHVKTFAPVARQEICLDDLLVAEGDTVKVKQSVRE